MRGPILLREFDAPEMRAGAEKLYADTRATLGRVAEIDHAALLLFFRGGIDEHQIRAELELLVQIEQAAVRVDHDGLALGAELLAQNVLALRLHGDAREDAGAATFAAGCGLNHHPLHRAMGWDASQLCRLGKCPKKQTEKVC